MSAEADGEVAVGAARPNGEGFAAEGFGHPIPNPAASQQKVSGLSPNSVRYLSRPYNEPGHDGGGRDDART